MEVPSEGPTIEFIDVAPVDAPSPDDPRPIRNRRAVVLLSGLALVAACLLVASVVSERSEDAVAPVTEAAVSTTTPPDPTDDSALPNDPNTSADASSPGVDDVGDFVPWPEPPADHNPIVIGRPGPDVPVMGSITEMAVVYVNSLGRPTIIDLDTGWIEQVDVADTRSYDFFGVEFGRIVSFDGRNSNVRPATYRSLLFHTHRAGSLTDLEDVRASVNLSPHLCLSTQPCSIDRWTFNRVTNGTDTIRLANAEEDPFVIDMLFGDSWSEARGTRRSGDEFGFELRVPVPLHDEAWIVHQPGSEAWRRMTRVN